MPEVTISSKQTKGIQAGLEVRCGPHGSQAYS